MCAPQIGDVYMCQPLQRPIPEYSHRIQIFISNVVSENMSNIFAIMRIYTFWSLISALVIYVLLKRNKSFIIYLCDDSYKIVQSSLLFMCDSKAIETLKVLRALNAILQ